MIVTALLWSFQDPEQLQDKSNEILTAIIQGMRKEEPSNNVKLAATNALLNSLEFTKANFDKEVRPFDKDVGSGGEKWELNESCIIFFSFCLKIVIYKGLSCLEAFISNLVKICMRCGCGIELAIYPQAFGNNAI